MAWGKGLESFCQIHVQCCGSGMFFPDPTFFHPGSRIRIFPSRIRIKEFKYFNTKKWFLSSRKYDPGCSSRIPDPDPEVLFTHPGSRIQVSKRPRIPDPGVKKAPDPGSHCSCPRIPSRCSEKVLSPDGGPHRRPPCSL
jgi:hypothetical protein